MERTDWVKDLEEEFKGDSELDEVAPLKMNRWDERHGIGYEMEAVNLLVEFEQECG